MIREHITTEPSDPPASFGTPPVPADPPQCPADFSPDFADAPTPETLPDETQSQLFDAYLNSGEAIPALTARLGITLAQFVAWHDHPDTQRALNDLDRIATQRAEHQRAQAAVAAIHALTQIASQTFDHPETARRAASQLLQPAPTTTRPRRPRIAPVITPGQSFATPEDASTPPDYTSIAPSSAPFPTYSPVPAAINTQVPHPIDLAPIHWATRFDQSTHHTLHTAHLTALAGSCSAVRC